MLNINDSDRARALRRIASRIEDIANKVERADESNLINGSLANRRNSPPSGTGVRDSLQPSLQPSPLFTLDSKRLRKIIRHRQLRARFFNQELLGDPGWDMLLDLAAAMAEQKRVSVTSLCIASGVPSSTALRWIRVLTKSDLLTRCDDEFDRRRAFVSLSDKGAELMAAYFELLGDDATMLV